MIKMNTKNNLIRKKNKKKLSFIIPVYDERDSLIELYNEIIKNIDMKLYTYELIFIDDGSSDGSFEVLLNIAKSDKAVKVIQFNRNYGKAAALLIGFRSVTGVYVFTMDADLQDNPEEIPNFLEKISQGFDVISGWKYIRKDPISKRVPSKLYNYVTAKITGVNIHDINCGFKIYKREVLDSIKIYGSLHRYIPIFAYWNGYRVTEIKVDHRTRKFGKTKYGFKRFFNGLFDLITVVFLTKFRDRPLHLFGSIGFIFLFSGFCIDLYLSIHRFVYGNFGNRRPLLWLGIFLMIIGFQFFSTGLIAELITKYNLSHDAYVIKNRINFKKNKR